MIESDAPNIYQPSDRRLKPLREDDFDSLTYRSINLKTERKPNYEPVKSNILLFYEDGEPA